MVRNSPAQRKAKPKSKAKLSEQAITEMRTTMDELVEKTGLSKKELAIHFKKYRKEKGKEKVDVFEFLRSLEEK